MKATDPMLLHIAQVARVKTPHVFHTYHTMREQKDRFNAVAYATFAGLEPHHVLRIVAAMTDAGITFETRQRISPSGQGGRLPADFSMPEDWLLWAQTQRSWTRDVAETEAATFVDYWHAQPGQKGVKLDWLGTWRNWVRRSHTPNGEKVRESMSEADKRASMQDTIRLYRKMGRHDEANALERTISGMKVERSAYPHNPQGTVKEPLWNQPP